jgi:hypothetical protein
MEMREFAESRGGLRFAELRGSPQFEDKAVRGSKVRCRVFIRPISSFFLRKKEDREQQDIKQYNNRFTTLAHYVHIPCETNTDQCW